jgi:hypothetical protein
VSNAPRTSARKQRAAAAYDAVTAWREPARQQIRRAVFTRVINEPTGNFLHWLLGQCGDKSYCAMPKDELAKLYGKSLSSIKLYIRESVARGILRVSGRRIYFVRLEAPEPTSKSYEQLVAEATALAQAGNLIDAGLLLKQAAEVRKQAEDQAEEQEQHEQPPAAQHEPSEAAEPEPEAFFCGSDESKNCPDSDNSLSEHPLKTPIPGGGEKDRDLNSRFFPETPTIQKLKALGSTAPKCWMELSDRPFAEIEYAAQLAQQAKWADDKPAATIYFARLIAAGVITFDSAAEAEAPLSPAAAAPLSPGNSDIWPRVQAELEQQLSQTEYETWLRDTRLIQIDAGVAVVGTPNIFAREKVESHYRDLIAEGITRVLQLTGRVSIQVVIDSSA